MSRTSAGNYVALLAASEKYNHLEITGYDDEKKDHMKDVVLLRRLLTRNTRQYLPGIKELVKRLAVRDVHMEAKERVDSCVQVYLDQIEKMCKDITHVTDASRSVYAANILETDRMHEVKQAQIIARSEGREGIFFEGDNDALEDDFDFESTLEESEKDEDDMENSEKTEKCVQIHQCCLQQKNIILKEIESIFQSNFGSNFESRSLKKITKKIILVMRSNINKSHKLLVKTTASIKAAHIAYERHNDTNISADSLIQGLKDKGDDLKRREEARLNEIPSPRNGDRHSLLGTVNILNGAKNQKERKIIFEYLRKKEWVPEVSFASMNRALKRYRANPLTLGAWEQIDCGCEKASPTSVFQSNINQTEEEERKKRSIDALKNEIRKRIRY